VQEKRNRTAGEKGGILMDSAAENEFATPLGSKIAPPSTVDMPAASSREARPEKGVNLSVRDMSIG
jgi:hypothetical protein